MAFVRHRRRDSTPSDGSTIRTASTFSRIAQGNGHFGQRVPLRIPEAPDAGTKGMRRLEHEREWDSGVQAAHRPRSRAVRSAGECVQKSMLASSAPSIVTQRVQKQPSPSPQPPASGTIPPFCSCKKRHPRPPTTATAPPLFPTPRNTPSQTHRQTRAYKIPHRLKRCRAA